MKCEAQPCFPLNLYVAPLRRYGGISVGGVNSQVRLTEEEIETAVRDLGDLLGPFLVRMNCFCVIQTGGNLLGRSTFDEVMENH